MQLVELLIALDQARHAPALDAEHLGDLAVWVSSVLDRDVVADIDHEPDRALFADWEKSLRDRFGVRESNLGSRRLVRLLTAERMAAVAFLALEKSPLGTKALDALLACALPNLYHLALRQCRISEKTLRALCDATNLLTVRSLHLGSNSLRDDGAACLAAARAFPDLMHLDIGWTRASEGGLGRLLNGPALKGLVSLTTSTDKWGRSEAEIIADASALTKLRRLTMYGQPLRTAGIRALAQSPVLKLTHLHLFECGVTNEALEELAASPILERPLSLRFRYDRITDDGVARLFAAPRIESLQTLQISQCALTTRAVEAIVSSPATRLRTLHLGTSPAIGRPGLSMLLEASNLEELIWLHINGWGLGDAAMADLARCDTLPSLRHLDLSHNQLTDEGIEQLCSWPQLKKLHRLSLHTNEITEAGLERLLHTEGLSLRQIDLIQTPCAAAAAQIAADSPSDVRVNTGWGVM